MSISNNEFKVKEKNYIQNGLIIAEASSPDLFSSNASTRTTPLQVLSLPLFLSLTSFRVGGNLNKLAMSISSVYI